MRKEDKKLFRKAYAALGGFVLWTALVSRVDVQSAGPMDSAVGFAAINQEIHRLLGVHLEIYKLTDWLSLIPLLIVMGFGALGLVQWIRRRDIRKVDPDILLLGGFYAVTLLAFAFFELVPVNYRPVLIDGQLEPSYPSSTTMLVLCVIPTAVTQIHSRIKHPGWKNAISCILNTFAVFMVLGRLISGVHWVTDIIGGILLSRGLTMLYRALCRRIISEK